MLLFRERGKCIHRSISSVSVSFDRPSLRKQISEESEQTQATSLDVARTEWNRRSKNIDKGEALDRYWDNRYGLVPTDQSRDRSPYRTVSPSSCSLRGRNKSQRRDRRCRRTSSAVIWIEMNPRMTSTLCRSQSERQCRWTRRKVWHVSWWRWRIRAMKKSKSIKWSASFGSVQRANGQEIEVFNDRIIVREHTPWNTEHHFVVIPLINHSSSKLSQGSEVTKVSSSDV